MNTIKRKNTIRRGRKTIGKGKKTRRKEKKYVKKMTGGVPHQHSANIKNLIHDDEWNKIIKQSDKMSIEDMEKLSELTRHNYTDIYDKAIKRYAMRDIILFDYLQKLRTLIYKICGTQQYNKYNQIGNITSTEEQNELILLASIIFETLSMPEINNVNNKLYIEQQIITNFSDNNILNMSCFEINKLLFLLTHAYIAYIPRIRSKLNDVH
jgi:hypothetical protein